MLLNLHLRVQKKVFRMKLGKMFKFMKFFRHLTKNGTFSAKIFRQSCQNCILLVQKIILRWMNFSIKLCFLLNMSGKLSNFEQKIFSRVVKLLSTCPQYFFGKNKFWQKFVIFFELWTKIFWHGFGGKSSQIEGWGNDFSFLIITTEDAKETWKRNISLRVWGLILSSN